MPVERLLDAVRSHAGPKPIVTLSFDDGFANFRQNVLPVLKHYSLLAIITAVTRCAGSDSPFPFDLCGQEVHSRTAALAWRPIRWAALEECTRSGLLSVGSDSHSHFMAFHCTDKELVEEAAISPPITQTRLGPQQGKIFWYAYERSHLGEAPPRYTWPLLNEPVTRWL